MAKRRKKKTSGLKIFFICILIVAILALAGAAAVLIYYNNTYKKSNFVSDGDVPILYDLLARLSGEEGETLDADSENAIRGALSGADDIAMADSSDVYNILLIGSDLREGSDYGNSDVMILISLNEKSRKVMMTSFMRDLYADIPAVGIRKLNSAFAVGGGPLLVRTLESNYRIDIDNYASFNFYSTARIIDLLGGVDIELSPEEVAQTNNNLIEVCQIEGLDPAGFYLSGSGMLHLNGRQAVAFCRIRSTGRNGENYDYARTMRQREVINQVFNVARGASVSTLVSLVNEIMPMITHNIEQSTLTSLITKLPSYMNYTMESARIPYDGLYTVSGEQLIPMFEETINRLHASIYGVQ